MPVNTARDLFQKVSDLQYPLYLAGLVYLVLPLTNQLQSLLSDYNKALVLYGLALSFSTLQDTTKSQNDFSLRIWQSPRHSKAVLTVIAVLVVLFLTFGLVGLVWSGLPVLPEIAFGVLSLGLGLLGVLKGGLEMAEHHQGKSATEPSA
jgi:fatty acid desaturase